MKAHAERPIDELFSNCYCFTMRTFVALLTYTCLVFAGCGYDTYQGPFADDPARAPVHGDGDEPDDGEDDGPLFDVLFIPDAPEQNEDPPTSCPGWPCCPDEPGDDPHPDTHGNCAYIGLGVKCHEAAPGTWLCCDGNECMTFADTEEPVCIEGTCCEPG